MAAIERPELFLVRPNIGQPLILLRGQFDEGLTLTFAGKTRWYPSSSDIEWWVKTDFVGVKNRAGRYTLRVADVSRIKVLEPENKKEPRTAVDFQYRAGFRWEFDIHFSIDPSIPVYEWPQMFDIRHVSRFWDAERKEVLSKDTLNHHAVYVDERWPRDTDRFTLEPDGRWWVSTKTPFGSAARDIKVGAVG